MDDVLRAVENEGLKHRSDGLDRYRVWDPQREHETTLVVTPAAMGGFISGFAYDDANVLFPGVPPETGAFRVLLANIFEGFGIGCAEIVVSESEVRFVR